MLIVYVPEAEVDQVAQALEAFELVAVRPGDKDPLGPHLLYCDGEHIHFPIPWSQEVPPLLFNSTVPYSEWHLRELVSGLTLAEFDRALFSGEVLRNLDRIQAIRRGEAPDPQSVEDKGLGHSEYHNEAVLCQYTIDGSQETVLQTARLYEKALDAPAPHDRKALTARLYADFLLDLDQYPPAVQVLEDFLRYAESPQARYFIKAGLVQAHLAYMEVPFDADVLRLLRADLQDCLNFFNDYGFTLEEAQLLKQGARINEMEGNYTEALRCLTKVEQLFEAEDSPYALASTHKDKGLLLLTWAQNGQPQFLAGAQQALGKALEFFTRQTDPHQYADIKQHLGLVYLQRANDPEKGAMMAAYSAGAFQEALEVFRDADPLQYAKACTNYAGALHELPGGNPQSRLERAQELLKEALSIRTAEYPYERAISLLNMMETRRALAQVRGDALAPLWAELQAYADEIDQLVDDVQLKESAFELVRSLNEL
jgi:tetratricopeptide (TPR) repeat protein